MADLVIELAVQTGRPESKLKTHRQKPGLVASDIYKMRRKGKVASGSGYTVILAKNGHVMFSERLCLGVRQRI